MMTLDAAAAFASGLPDVVVGARWGNRTWLVNGHGFVWVRPLGKADLARFGDEKPPTGDIIGVIVEDLDAKDALLAIAPPGFFTIEHFNGYSAVLVALRVARTRDVRAAIRDAWTVASKRKPKAARKPRTRRKARS
jgi:hypothetical protein